MTGKLYDRVKTAPFLKGQNIENFLDEVNETPDELALSAETKVGGNNKDDLVAKV
jgi:hypothetical protein